MFTIVNKSEIYQQTLDFHVLNVLNSAVAPCYFFQAACLPHFTRFKSVHMICLCELADVALSLSALSCLVLNLSLCASQIIVYSERVCLCVCYCMCHLLFFWFLCSLHI